LPAQQARITSLALLELKQLVYLLNESRYILAVGQRSAGRLKHSLLKVSASVALPAKNAVASRKFLFKPLVMPLKNSFWQHFLLSNYVICFGAGLFQWDSAIEELDGVHFKMALSQGFLIGLTYFAFQHKFFQSESWFKRILYLAPVSLYLVAYQKALPFLWFWLLLMLQVGLLLTYQNGPKWRKIPGLKNMLIAAMWFIQLHLIPGLAGSVNLLFTPFFIFYLALSIQVDIEDIEEDAGQIKTLAGLLGKNAASYLVIFLLTLFAFIIGLPWVWIMLALIVIQREFTLPKRSYDSLLFFLGLYFLLR